MRAHHAVLDAIRIRARSRHPSASLGSSGLFALVLADVLAASHEVSDVATADRFCGWSATVAEAPSAIIVGAGHRTGNSSIELLRVAGVALHILAMPR